MEYIGKNCPYCQTPVKPGQQVITCEKCDITHHEDCWLENGGCTTYGCLSSSDNITSVTAPVPTTDLRIPGTSMISSAQIKQISFIVVGIVIGILVTFLVTNPGILKSKSANNPEAVAVEERKQPTAGDNSTAGVHAPQPRTGEVNLVMISGGWYHNIALAKDGTVWFWGTNYTGELAGEAAKENKPTFTQVPGLTSVKSIDVGCYHNLALRKDGTVWAWGNNDSGQIGDGTTDNRLTPVRVAKLSNVEAIAAGYSHSVALKKDGTVWTWGMNCDSQLGVETSEDKSVLPVQVPGLNNVVAIAAGEGHTLVLKKDGSLWSWGSNSNGQLGSGSKVAKSVTPVQVSGLTTITAIASGGFHNLALRRDGTVWAWGSNCDGQLGNGTNKDSSLPVQINGFSGAAVVVAGEGHSVILKQDGSVWVFGLNIDGQLGDGSTDDRFTPVQVPGLTDVFAVTGGYSHTVVLRQDGTIYVWGNNRYGQLGIGAVACSYNPVKVNF